MNTLLAGFIAGIPVGLVSALLLWFRSSTITYELKETNSGLDHWDDTLIAILFTSGSAAASLGIGLLAGWIYGRLSAVSDNAPLLFIALATILGLITTLLAVISKTPMRFEKILMNVLFALGLGILIPLLAG